MVVGHHKGGDTKAKIYRNFGYARPEGYRKAIRLMRMAEKFRRPIVVFVDTPAAYPGVESEERGVAEAIAFNLREMSVLKVPVVVIITGEGGSGGALGIAIGDRILMQEYAIYSVIPPEGCAAILWRDSGKKVEAATALKLTAPRSARSRHRRRNRSRADWRRPHELRRSRDAARWSAARRTGIRERPRHRSAPRPPLRQVPRHGPPGRRFYGRREHVTLQILPCLTAETRGRRELEVVHLRFMPWDKCGTLKFNSSPTRLSRSLRYESSWAS